MSPSEKLFEEGAVFVDLDGNALNTKKPALAVAQARDGKAYIVMDERIARLFSHFPYYVSTAPGIAFAYFDDYRRGRPDLFHEAPTLEGLARAAGLPADRLQLSCAGLAGERFYAMGPVQAMLTTTEGSLDVDTQCRVLKTDGRPIDGLYAVGCVGQGGMMLRGHGMHYAWIMTSGRVAGESAARRMPAGA
jgi:fumarate reductase flavoprotein subunit